MKTACRLRSAASMILLAGMILANALEAAGGEQPGRDLAALVGRPADVASSAYQQA